MTHDEIMKTASYYSDVDSGGRIRFDEDSLMDFVRALLPASPAAPAQSGEAVAGSPAYALRGLYKPAMEYFIDGKPVTPDEYITWQAGIIEAVTKAKLPDPKYYGGSAEEGDQHEVKCAYVDGWNECRASILAAPQPSRPASAVQDDERAAFEAWARVEFDLRADGLTRNGHDYKYTAICDAWAAWQARAASPQATATQPAQTGEAVSASHMDEMKQRGLDECIRRAEEQGMKQEEDARPHGWKGNPDIAPLSTQPAKAGKACKCARLGYFAGIVHHPLCDQAPGQSAAVLVSLTPEGRALYAMTAAQPEPGSGND
ncbi:hypothetical protein FVF58_09305 [Paraburkholderia panacisoli]|uniref:Uncharacterized protein n=1 Tax=Paraburkholderia panacisoli TaxID=2603818 RepID=A0A5B0HCW0_9BURK|nr:hypothetical protein [Paraburkholderia panacisoli]KAA1012981.1 hypothetical protein FVF58_09305 [Paraburkholderia panacisoli]